MSTFSAPFAKRRHDIVLAEGPNMGISLVFFVSLVPTVAFAENVALDTTRTDGIQIEVGVRALGVHVGQAVPLESPRIVRLDDLSLQWSERFDAQAGAKRWYLGVPLGAVLSQHARSSDSDLALLHFTNGMIVPVPIPNSNSEIFIARATRRAKNDPADYAFPEVPKKQGMRPDPRPITFGANKVVVEGLEHPFAPDPKSSSFSPWAYVDTLIGIELVRRERWDRQFDVGTGVIRHGRDVFLSRCQFCHGVREVGAKFGWDFVDPTPLFEYRTPKSLYPHVRFQNTIAAEKGAMMPAQKDVVPAEIEDLWAWMKAIAILGPRPYAP